VTNQLDSESTATGKSRRYEVHVYCQCGRFNDRLHDIAPGCPGMDGPVQYIPGQEPGTVVDHWPRPQISDSVLKRYTTADGKVKLIPFEEVDVEEDRAPVSTVAVIQGLREELEYKGATAGTFVAYEKQWRRIAEAFPLLPASDGPLIMWMQQFKNPKNRGLWHQALSQLYKHAVKRFGFPSNPLDGIPRPQAQEKPVVALTLAEARALDGAPEDEQERLVVDLLLGHGWRGVELRRLTAANVRSAREGEIWIWGKERKEFGPLLNETRDLLLRLAQGLSDDEPVLRARRTQYGVHQPLGDDGLRRWVEDLCRRAGLTEYKPHDMRRTFGTLVARHSGDSHLVERLLRHGKPSVTDRYIQWNLPALLEQYSPIHLVRLTHQDPEFTRQADGKASPTDRGPGGTASS